MGPAIQLRKPLQDPANKSKLAEDSNYQTTNCKRRVNIKFATSIIQETLKKNQSLRKGKVKGQKPAEHNIAATSNELNSHPKAELNLQRNNTSTMSSQPAFSPNNRGGRSWRGKKKKSPYKPVSISQLPMVVQGIPHLANSFIQKDMLSKDSEKENSETAIDNMDGAESKDKRRVETNNSSTVEINKTSTVEYGEQNLTYKINPDNANLNSALLGGDAEADAICESQTQNELSKYTVSTLPMNHNMTDVKKNEHSEIFEESMENKRSNMNISEIEGGDEEEKKELREQELRESRVKAGIEELIQRKREAQSVLAAERYSQEQLKRGKMEDLGNSKDSKKLFLAVNKDFETANIKDSPKVEPPKVEFISEYSSVDVKKKTQDTIKFQSKFSEPPKTDPPYVPIGPLQPVIQLVDPVQLEKETEQYYKEMGSISSRPITKITKPQCLTPGQIAKITKDYPQMNPNKDKPEDSEKQKNAWTLLHQYWTFVQENPYDFDGWTYLLNHVETIDNIEAARSAFQGFLPLYPYCFAYWMKLSDLELKFSDLEQALGVLYLGTKCVPFCPELWVPLLNKFLEYANKENISEDVVRGLYEYALSNLGLSWNSSSIWDVCINYELIKGDLVRVMNLYRRILSIPTKLYNKHWDHLLALVRDYHPRNLLTIEEYSNLKKNACDLLKIKFNPPSLEEPKSLLKVTQPEDKIHTTIKEKIVASMIPIHEANEKECEKRWKYEEKIKRPYFHVKPLEKKQLKMWREYLDFEMKEGDPVRIVTLFERCLVPCAMYEEFWCKYTSYMENHVLNVQKNKYANIDYKPGCFSPSEKSADDNDGGKSDGKDDKKSDKIADSSDSGETITDLWLEGTKKLEVTPEIKFEVTFLLNRLSEGIGVGGRVLTPPPLTPASILRELTWEDVRQIYRRGAWIHCPSKPLILMQWAEFEEAQENIQTARELLNTVIVKHPKLLKARVQLIELERRSNELDRVEELYAQTFSIFNETRIRSCIAIRYARFLFKIREEDDKALLILRKALKKDKGNIHLYHHVFDVCYQRRPIDCNGVLASVMLALASKELSLEDKYWFCIKRSEFLREHGTMTQVKEAKAEMEEIKVKLDKEKLTNPKLDDDDDDDEEGKKNDSKSNEDKKSKEVNNNTEIQSSRSRKDQNQVYEPDQVNGKVIDLGARKNDSPLILLQQPPVPPVLDPVRVSKREGKDRERRKKREERDGSSDGRRRKRKSSRSSKKEKKSSRKSKRHRRRDAEEEEEEGEAPEEGELEEVYDANGVLLYSSKEDINSDMNSNYPQYRTNLQPSQEQQQQHQHQQQQQQQRMVGMENKPYQAVPPSWDLNASTMSNYGYGGASEVVKDGQNSLYERYYDMIKKGYDASQPRDANHQIPPTGHGVKAVLENKNCYLPPPPMPQGILGESLFNQGKLENLHNLIGKQRNLPSANNPPVFPPPATCLPPVFATRTMPPQEVKPNSEQNKGPPLPFLPAPPMGIPASQLNPTTQINPNIMQTNAVTFNRNTLLEPPGKVARMDQSSHTEANHGPHMQRNSHGILGDYPGSKSSEREIRGGRGNRNIRSRDRPRHQHHQNMDEHGHSSSPSVQHQPIPPPPQPQFNPPNVPYDAAKPQLISMNIKEILQDNVGNSLCNVPEWLIKEGGELRLSDTANGESIIRYWPRYLNDDGHTTLFQSLRKTVKWHQRRMLVGPASEDNWVNVPKLLSWIGPCSYEKDGMVLAANTQWPPEVVDLLHRLIRFSNSQFNSCLMSLYNTGYSHHPWHTEAHEAMAKNPTTACISLGVTRTLEMKRVNGGEYLRFPLFPGSLFIMEGACHTDWLCQIPKEQQVKGERINLSFRTMLMIKGVTV